MQHYLAAISDQHRTAWLKRFTPRHWTVDFARPMMAAVTAPVPSNLRVTLDFQTRSDLCGLIWSSEDRWSHPLLAYETNRDYRGISLVFDWLAGPGVMPLSAINGAVLTVEGRDGAGVPQVWYVRLWNYASGSPLAARITLDFDNLRAGFGEGGDLIFAGDIDRMFISLVPEAFDGTAAPLPETVATWVELNNVRATGLGSTIAIGDAYLPEHGFRICSGYDDSYNQSPERIVEQWQSLGYRELANHYVGMSHYYALTSAGAGRFEVSSGLCSAARAWHDAFVRALVSARMGLILSLSYELFDANAPAAWVQRDLQGERGLTGWVPPSALLSPTNPDAMQWLQGIAAEFVGLAEAGGQSVQFQVGEPWWWVGPSGRPCFYDPATTAKWIAEKGGMPPAMLDVAGERSVDEVAFLDWLGVQLAVSTQALREAAQRATQGAFRSLLLFYAPQVLDREKPELYRANMPIGWAWPSWDVLQLEDYSFVTAGDEAGMVRGRVAVAARLGYPVENQHYLAGFVLRPEDALMHWPVIASAASQARKRQVSEVLIWAWPQIARDGFTIVAVQLDASAAAGEDGDLDSFHDVLFPLELGFDASGGPEFQTQVAVLASGHEQRNQLWAQARLIYDAGLGVRSEADLMTLVAFFRARRGQAFAFRFRDPMDWRSCAIDAEISPFDQPLLTGNGAMLSFPLTKSYGLYGDAEVRRITRPVPESVRIAVDGEEALEGWTLLPGGIVQFTEPPSLGATVSAGFAFDVPVRFATDQLQVSLSGWRAGELPNVPLIEVRE